MTVKSEKLTQIDGYSIASYKTVSGNIKSIEKKGKELQSLIHATAIQALVHAKAYGDVTLMTKLVQALPSSSRKEALKVWVKDFSPLLWKVNKKEGTEGYVMDKAPSRNAFAIPEADVMPFWEYTKEEKPKDALTLAQLIALINRNIDKIEKIAKGESKEHLDDSENPEMALAIVHKLRDTMLPFIATNSNEESDREITENTVDFDDQQAHAA